MLRGYGSGSQTVTRFENLKWRVFSKNDDGSIDLISCIDSENELDSCKVGLNGSTGYNNGVLILNYICRKNYTNVQLQSKIKVRNINIEDIEKHFNPIAINIRDSFTNDGIQYDKPATYTGTRNYPILYNYENLNRLGTSEEYYENFVNRTYETTSTDGYTLRQKAYKLTANDNTPIPTPDEENSINNYINDSKVYEMLFGVSYDYWLSSRTICLNTNSVDFGLRKVKNNNLLWNKVFDDSGKMIDFGDAYPLTTEYGKVMITKKFISVWI